MAALAVWQLNSRPVLESAAGSHPALDVSAAAWRLAIDAHGRPEVRPLADSANTLLVAVPDVEVLRRKDSDGPLAWRRALRECLAR